MPLGLLILYLVFAMNGLSFCLIVVLIALFDYLNNGNVSISPAIELLLYFILSLILTSVCFRQLAFWT